MRLDRTFWDGFFSGAAEGFALSAILLLTIASALLARLKGVSQA